MEINKKQITLLSLITILFWFSHYTYIPNFSPYLLELGASHRYAGIILGSYGFAQMLLRMPFGLWADRVGRNKMFISAGLILAFVSATGLWLFPQLLSVFAFRTIAGISATTWIAFTVLFSSYYKIGDTVKAMSVIFASCYIGQISAMLIGSLVAEYFNQEAVFLTAMIGAVVGLFLCRNINESRPAASQRISVGSQLKQVLSNQALLSVSLISIIYQIITFATVYGFTPVYADDLGATDFQLGILSVLSVLPIAVAALITGYFMKQTNERSLVITGFVIIGLTTAVIPMVGTVSTLYLTQFAGAFGRGILFPMLMGLSIKTTPLHLRSTSMGFFQTSYGLGMVLGPVIAGLISDSFGLGPAFILLGGLALLGAVLAYFKINNDQTAKVMVRESN